MRGSIAELETALAKVKLANSLGCSTQELVQDTLNCPAEKLGMLIGKGGTRIAQIMAETQTTLEVDKETGIVEITGSAAAVAQAKLQVEAIAQAVETEVTLTPPVATYLTASHIDVWTTLKKTKYNDIYMDLARGQQKVVLRGAPDRVQAAKLELLALDVTREERTLIGREFSYLLGKKGSRIDQLVQDFKVVIDVTKHKETDTATAVVTGAPSTVKDCMTAIQESLDSNREVTETIVLESPTLKQILLADSGQHIKALQAKVNEVLKAQDETASCYLSISKESKSEELLVKVKQSSMDQALEETERGLQELKSFLTTLQVDPYIVPRIIGKGGETIKELTHGKPLFLEVDRKTGQVVVGATTKEGHDSLLAQIQQLIQDNSVLRLPGDPNLIKTQYRELGRIAKETKAAIQELAWLDLDEAQHAIILRGKAENLQTAKALLEEYLANNTMEDVAVMDEDFDVLLSGGKNSKITKLSQELDVNLSADRSKGIVTMRGSTAKMADAKTALSAFLNGGDGQSVAKLSVTDQLVGTIIGKGGKTRKDLEAKYSPVSIHISKTYRVSIRGPTDKVNECRMEILKMISAARVTQIVSGITSEQKAKLEKNDALKRIQYETHAQLSIGSGDDDDEGKVTIRGFFHDVRDAVSLLNEQLTGEFKSSVELDASQFARVSATSRDPSHFRRMQAATDTNISLESSSGEIVVSGKRSNVKRGKEQVYDFLAFVCPGEVERLKITKPLYVTVGQATSLADIAAAVGGATIHLDRDSNSIVIRDTDKAKVQAAAKMVQTKIKDAERLAYVLEIAPDEAWLISYIIGKNGSRIQSLQQGSDCHVDVSKETRTITVTGEWEDKVASVREKLTALVEQGRRENLVFGIPEKAIPAFMGTGGKKVKDLSKELGVEIQRVNKKSSQFKIVGDEVKVETAKKHIDEWLTSWEQSHASVETAIEKQYVSAILGQKGSTAQALEKEFECKIDLDRAALKLTIRGGTAEQRQGALARVQEIIENEAAIKAEAAAKRKADAAQRAAAASAEEEVTTSGNETLPTDSQATATSAAPIPAVPVAESTSNQRNQCTKKYPSHPVGVKPSHKGGSSNGNNSNGNKKKNQVDPNLHGGTEQGRNLFNLLVEG